MRPVFIIVLTALAVPAAAQENRQLDAHEHGVGELNIAFDGSTVVMEFHAPGADIVGFEYEAETAEDRAAIEAAVAMLARPLDLFVLPEAAECTIVQASAELEGDMDGDHGDHDEHEDHAEGEDHADHDDHADEHHDDEGRHTEFHAEYELTCANPAAVSDITFAYFDSFENARELKVQIVSASGAQAFEIERDTPTLDLRGMF